MKSTELVDRYFYLVRLVALDLQLPDSADPHLVLSGGMQGLLDSTRRYRIRKGPFENYARSCIRWGMLEALRNDDWLPRGVRAQITKGEIEGPQFVPVNDQILEIKDHRKTPAEAMERKELSSAIRTRIDSLEELERQVLLLYYFRDLRLHQIGTLFGMSEASISILKSKGLTQLFKPAK